MGTCLSNGSSFKTEPGFDDDFFFHLPMSCDNNERRKEFDENLNSELKSRNEDFREFQNTTRLLGRTFFLCLFELSKRSFDFKEICDALEKRREDSFSFLETFSTVMRRNFEFFGKSERFLDIRETKDNNDSCYDVKFRASEKLGTKEEPPANRKESFNEYEKVSIQVMPVNTQEDGDDIDKNNLTVSNVGDQSLSEIVRTEKEEKIAFEELLRCQLVSDETQQELNRKNKSKLKCLERKIDEMKVRIDKQQQENDECFDREMKASSEKIKRSEEEYRKAEEEKQKVQDEEIRKLREERKEYEKETERMRQESLVELQTRINAILECFALNQKWQMKEEEWENWLKFLRSKVSVMKQQFMKFESVCHQLDTHGIIDEDTIKAELSILHDRTLSSFDVLSNAYFNVKTLSEENPGRGFLLILQSQISNVCQRILSVLYGIDSAKVDEDLIEILRGLFSTFDSSDIFYTSKLRDMEKSGNLEKFQNAKDPEQYTPKRSTTVEEVSDELTKSSNVEEKLQTSDIEQNGILDGQQSNFNKEGSENDGEPEQGCLKKDSQEPPIIEGEVTNRDNSEFQKETTEGNSIIAEP
ncbi:unnamed protein product [Caenorhabditis brenneri]